MVVTVIGGAIAAILVFAVMLNVAGSNQGADVSPGGRTRDFVVGRAAELIDSVKRHGPLLFQDPLEGSLNIYVQHIEGETWRAFESRPPGASARCQLAWQPAPRHFTDSCSGRTYPFDGTGLVSYPARVDGEGRLLVDLRSPTISSTTSAPHP